MIMVNLLSRKSGAEHGEPDRSPPIRVAAEQAGARFVRLVGDGVVAPVRLDAPGDAAEQELLVIGSRLLAKDCSGSA